MGGHSWTYSYDDSGNMTGKTNSTDIWTYSWNDENRLIRVQGPGSVDMAYTYDSIGRMLTRDDGADLTQFTWDDQWNCIKEVTGESETVYHIPEGQILSFIRDGERFEIHVDALGSTRMITDDEGEVVARYEYGAFGSAISVTEDPALTNFPMRFVGSAGLRTEALSGLVCVRERWYDCQIQRWLSLDKVMSTNRYEYSLNSPLKYRDTDGLKVSLGEGTANLCDQLAPGYVKATGQTFQQRWDGAMNKAIAQAEEMQKQPGEFWGFEEVYENDGKSGIVGKKVKCKWPQVDYLGALTGNKWNVKFRLAEPGEFLDDDGYDLQTALDHQHSPWGTQSGSLVAGASFACASSSLELSRQILHELTHAAIFKAKGRIDPKGPGFTYPKGGPSHPLEWFGHGIDCKPCEEGK